MSLQSRSLRAAKDSSQSRAESARTPGWLPGVVSFHPPRLSFRFPWAFESSRLESGRGRRRRCSCEIHPSAPNGSAVPRSQTELNRQRVARWVFSGEREGPERQGEARRGKAEQQVFRTSNQSSCQQHGQLNRDSRVDAESRAQRHSFRHSDVNEGQSDLTEILTQDVYDEWKVSSTLTAKDRYGATQDICRREGACDPHNALSGCSVGDPEGQEGLTEGEGCG